MITLSTSGGNFPGNRDLIDGIFCISLNIILVMVKIKTPFVLLIVECTRRSSYLVNVFSHCAWLTQGLLSGVKHEHRDHIPGPQLPAAG